MSEEVPVPAPVHWPRVAARWLFDRVHRLPKDNDGIITAFRDGQVTLRSNRRVDGFTNAVQEIGYQGVRAGDLVIHSMDGFAGAIGVSDSDGKASPVVHCYVPRSNADARYYAYLLRDLAHRGFITSLAKGIRERSTSFDAESFRNLALPCPPLAEQRAIADYLDAETARLDALIAKKHQLIHLLDERIDAAIMDVVEGSVLVLPGGHPAVEIRRVLTKLNRQPAVAEMITAFRDGQVTARSARGKDGFTNSWTENAQVQGVQTGDVVVHGLDGFSGAIGDAEADGVCSPVYHVCRPQEGGDPAFYGRLLRLLALEGYLGNFAVSTRERAVDFRNWDLFGRIPIPYVDVQLQRAIGDRIRSLRPLVELVKRSESLAVERKTALISRVVVGATEAPVRA